MSIKKLISENKKRKERIARKKAVKNAALGAAAGAVVGGALGILLAPKSGKETREEISEGVKNLAEKAKEQLDNAKEKINEASDKIKVEIIKNEERTEEKTTEIANLNENEASAEDETKE